MTLCEATSMEIPSRPCEASQRLPGGFPGFDGCQHGKEGVSRREEPRLDPIGFARRVASAKRWRERYRSPSTTLPVLLRDPRNRAETTPRSGLPTTPRRPQD